MFHPDLHSAAELEKLVQQMGFLPFFRCAVPQFSVEEFTPGRYWFVDGVDGSWEWRMELARRGVVAYGKLFAKKAGLVSQEWYPDLANYRRSGYDCDARYEDGLAGYREKCVMDVLLREGPTLSKDLKKLAGFGGDGMKGVDTVITNLQMQTYVTVHSFEYAHDKYGRPYGWGDRALRGNGGCAGRRCDPERLPPHPGRIQRELFSTSSSCTQTLQLMILKS